MTTRAEGEAQVANVALNRHLGLEFDGRSNDEAFAHFVARPELLAFGTLHGGVLYALLDAMCLLALFPMLTSDQHAVTHDLHVSVMRPVQAGATCKLIGKVVRFGRSLAFLEARAEVDGKLVATAHVTKSIVKRG